MDPHPSGGSSANTKVVRLDQRTGKARGSQPLAQSASDLTLAHGKVWVVHGSGREGQLTLLDPRSLAGIRNVGVKAFVRSIAANDHGVFAAGGEWDKSGVVVKFDGETGAETARRALPGQFINALAATPNEVIAIGRQGTIWLLSPQDLSIKRIITLTTGEFVPQTVLPTPGTLYITTHRGQGENGSVIAINGWSTGAAQPAPQQVAAPTVRAGVWRFDGLTSSEESEGRGELYSATVNIRDNAGDMAFILTCYPKDRKIELAMQGPGSFEALAHRAIKAGHGRFGGQDSYIDLVIEGQAYPLKAAFFEMNGELNLDSGYRANGRIVNGLLKSSAAAMNMSNALVTIPLQNSRNSICRALRQCGIIQSYCRSKGL